MKDLRTGRKYTQEGATQAGATHRKELHTRRNYTQEGNDGVVWTVVVYYLLRPGLFSVSPSWRTIPRSSGSTPVGRHTCHPSLVVIIQPDLNPG